MSKRKVGVSNFDLVTKLVDVCLKAEGSPAARIIETNIWLRKVLARTSKKEVDQNRVHLLVLKCSPNCLKPDEVRKKVLRLQRAVVSHMNEKSKL